MKLTFILIIFSMAVHTAHAANKPKAVYGKNANGIFYGADNRHEVTDYHDNLLKDYAKSVAAMVANVDLVPNADLTQFSFEQIPVAQAEKLCAGEKYANQPTLSVCTGFLVSEDLLLTAGHCIEDIIDCRRYQWVFDFKKDTTSFTRQQVYGCKEIIKKVDRDSYFTLKDYALIRLKRKTGRAGLPFRTTGKIKRKTPVAIIGHPLGIPMKIADNAKVQKKTIKEFINPIKFHIRKKYYFYADVDAYAGNSGSPIINLETGLVEGLLSNGNEDFKKDRANDCHKTDYRKVSRRKATEAIFKITRLVELLQQQNK